MSINNSTEQAMAQRFSKKTRERRSHCARVVMLIPNPLSTSIFNTPSDSKTTVRGEPFGSFDSGKEEPCAFFNFTTKNSY